MNAPVPEAQPYTALVIDDNFDNRLIFRISLETVGYSVSECEDGVSGLNCLAEKTYNLLILDLQMPKLDGRYVLRKVREQQQHKQMHVVVVTANAHMATDDIDTLADYVMYKPINVVEFSDFAKRLSQLQQG